MNKKTRTIIWIVLGVVLVLLFGIMLSGVIGQAEEISFEPQFVGLLKGTADIDGDGTVEIINKLNVDAYNWTAYIMDGEKIVKSYTAIGPSIYDYNSLYTLLGHIGALDSTGAPAFEITFEDPNAGSILSSLMPTFFSLLAMGVLLWLLMRNTSGAGSAAMNVGKSKAQMQNNLKVRFSDVAGAEEEKEELEEVVEFLKAPRKFAALGAKIPTGVLLVGPPGTGKTLFAKAVAGEAGVPFFSVSGSDFVEMYVGMGAKRVRDLFDMAKKNQPCIIFIDEIDAVGRHRGAGHGGGHDEREQTLNQILVQMDGFESTESIIVMAATNRADILDPALLRPGRFDRQINVNLPDVKGREQILKVHARNKPMAQDVNFKTVARITAGFSGADLANLLNEAAILAARGNKKAIDNVDIYEAFDKTIMGLKKKSHVITEADKRVTAYHEAGHAVLAELCKFCDPVHEVTIIPRGNGAGGFTMTRPVEDSSFSTYNEMRDHICMALGGRAAETIVLKNVTQGASADLRSVTSIARRMVTQYGMSEELGLVAYGSDQPVFMGMEYGHSSHDYSQETAAKIDKEVRRIINEEYEKAVRLLQENRSILDNMARVLVEKETIYTEEVSLLMKGASYKEVIEAIENSGNDREKDPFARMVKPEAEETEKTEKAEDSVDADAGQSLEELAKEAMEKLSENVDDDKEQE